MPALLPLVEPAHESKDGTGTPGHSQALECRSRGGSAGEMADLGAVSRVGLDVGGRDKDLLHSQE